MLSGTAAGAVKPITLLALEAFPVIGSASATLMMSRAATLAHQQDGYTNAAASRDTARSVRSGYLPKESIHEVLGGTGLGTPYQLRLELWLFGIGTTVTLLSMALDSRLRRCSNSSSSR